MNWFPQIGQGSLTQFPFGKARSWRAIRNELESGEQILMPDADGGQIDWTLSYKDLSDDEAKKLTDLFATSAGSFLPFGLVDPLINLLAWSGDLTRPDWQPGQLTAVKGANDPDGKQEAWTLTNGTSGDQQLVQTVSLPGEYVTCFSAWLRSDRPCTVALQRDGVQAKAATGQAWNQFFISGSGLGGAQNAAYSLTLPAGQTIQLWGLQVEAQPYPSQYKTSTTATGIYQETYFATDELTVRDTAPGLHSCEVKLSSRA